MTNNEIRARAWQVYKAAFLPPILLASITALVGMIDSITQNYAIILAVVFTGLVLGVLSHYFYIRAWTDGKADLKNLTVFLTQPIYSKKLLPIIGFEILIYGLMTLPVFWMLLALLKGDVTVLISFGALMIVWRIVFSVVVVAFSQVWKIFVFEPELKVTQLFKKSAKYMAHHWLEMMWFNFTLVIIPVIATFMLSNVIDPNIVTLLLIPINAYISIATTGFVYENIIVAEHQKELAAQQEVLPTAEETLVVTEEILPEVTAEQTELNTVSDETNE